MDGENKFICLNLLQDYGKDKSGEGVTIKVHITNSEATISAKLGIPTECH